MDVWAWVHEVDFRGQQWVEVPRMVRSKNYESLLYTWISITILSFKERRVMLRSRILARNAQSMNSSKLGFAIARGRSYSWNPFVVTTVEDGPPAEGVLDETVVNATQELRDRTIAPQRLKQILQDLALATPGRRTFGLMGDVIKKLATSTPQTGSDAIIPLFDDREALQLFIQVIDNIDKENFESARFVPRLYLQLLDRANQLKDDEMLLDVFTKFVEYLSVLGYSEQLSKVSLSFFSEYPRLSGAVAQRLNSLFDNHDNFSPFLLMAVADAYDHTSSPSNKATRKLQKKVLDSVKRHLESNQDQIFSIDSQEIKAFQNFCTNYAEHTDSLTALMDIYECCSINGSQYFEDQRRQAALKIVSVLMNGKGLSKLSFSNSIRLCQTLIECSEAGISKEELLVASSSTANLLTNIPQEKLNKESFLTFIQWDVFKNSKLTSNMRQELLSNHEYVDVQCYNSIIKALASPNPMNFSAELEEIDHFFFEEFSEISRDLHTFEILLQRGVKKGNYEYLTRLFEESLNEGVNWEERPGMLFEFLIALTEQADADARQVFKWYRRVKVFCEYLNADSYSALMSLLLKQGAISTALASFEHELPKLEKGSKFKVDNYPKLYSVIINWILNECNDVQNAWDMYGSLMKYFELPYESYLPVMKKFVALERPDAALMIFQELKKIHRNTGKLPPPNAEMYIFLFNNFGTQLYDYGVDNLHLMLKVDLDINSDINIMNSLLNAYTNINEFKKVSDLFDQIISIPEKVGFNNDTITIMLKAYTFIDLNLVSNFWNNLDQFNILPNSANLNQLVIAHCYHGKHKEALRIVQSCENDLDIPVTPQILGSLYKWTDSLDLRNEIEHWALMNHKSLWQIVDKNALVLAEPTKDELELGISPQELSLIRG